MTALLSNAPSIFAFHCDLVSERVEFLSDEEAGPRGRIVIPMLSIIRLQEQGNSLLIGTEPRLAVAQRDLKSGSRCIKRTFLPFSEDKTRSNDISPALARIGAKKTSF
jgi:hypothetical protein